MFAFQFYNNSILVGAGAGGVMVTGDAEGGGVHPDPDLTHSAAILTWQSSLMRLKTLSK